MNHLLVIDSYRVWGFFCGVGEVVERENAKIGWGRLLGGFVLLFPGPGSNI